MQHCISTCPSPAHWEKCRLSQSSALVPQDPFSCWICKCSHLLSNSRCWNKGGDKMADLRSSLTFSGFILNTALLKVVVCSSNCPFGFSLVRQRTLWNIKVCQCVKRFSEIRVWACQFRLRCILTIRCMLWFPLWQQLGKSGIFSFCCFVYLQ